MKQTIVFVLYDSVTNSIFDGQVAQPLLLQKKNNPELDIVLTTFENTINQSTAQKIINRYPEIRFILLKKHTFIHRFFLFPLIKNLHKALYQLPPYKLIARGPIAAYVCRYAAYGTPCTEMIIQARGLLAEEYRYVHRQSHFLSWPLHAIRAHFFDALEKISYSPTPSLPFPIIIQTVSVALKNYLVTHCKTDEKSISVSDTDIPPSIPEDLRITWRQEIREQLHLSDHYVYCYNGSVKPWQCPQETLLFFKKQLEINPQSYLLILSQNHEEFKQLVQKAHLPQGSYTILCVDHNDIYRYLAACDAGLLFRDSTILNWVSRPTKALEYQAVGLPIIHNNTIAFLQE